MRAAHRLLLIAVSVTTAVALLGAGAGAAANVQVISTDPLANRQSQHQTEVEPDTFANGTTVVSGFQVGRIYNGGSGAIGWATSTDSGATWAHGILPGLTQAAPVPGPYSRATDPSVAYDAKDGRWLITTLAMNGTPGVAVTVNSSTDGITWGNATVAATRGANLDKDWITCDNTPTSPFYGHCYIEYDDNGNGDLVYNTTSSDGGQTWSPPKTTADNTHGLGGQPLVKPDGTVIVPIANGSVSGILSYHSSDGGTTWSASSAVSGWQRHRVHGNMRDGLPSAEMDGAGTVYLTWNDCRFRARCSSNDLVISTSSDGVNWSTPARVPIDAVTSTVDHFIPGIGVDRTTSGATAHLTLTYYFFPQAACSGTACQLQVGQISSTSGLSGWGAETTLTSSPMQTRWLANTSQGRMVGDYISTSYVSGSPVAAFPIATAPDSLFHESMAASS
ncbi:MAG: exo-alpha-sialidase [Acidimicrobiia bacterium]|nr:exo-alpha-sialidase [Acidimicrobiia bacterium]MBV9039623.1 exo-alpha-sialidase [Acidimicrobiia bacterium]